MGQINQPQWVEFSTQQMPNFITNSATVLRQMIDESNHEMVHMLAQQMRTIFNTLIQTPLK